MAEPLLAFKAGRAFRQESTNTVLPNPEKGAIILQNDDGLLHFMWRNRTTNEIEEDLILFPGDASFIRVPQGGGRVYVLKFSSSNQRHFFWLQDASSARDDEFVSNVNRLLQDPENVPIWGGSSHPQASTSTAPPPSFEAAVPSVSAAPGVAAQPTPEQLERLRSILSGMSSGAPAEPELLLLDVLTPANLTPLFTSHPDLVPALFPHLPPDLPVPPSPETLQRIISSPQFRGAVRNFDQALRTGLLGHLMPSLGLPEEAGLGIEAFLNAVQEQARRQGGGADGTERMETD